MNYDDILYLDVDFLANKYEEATGIAPKTVVSKNEGMDAQAGISWLKSKIHSQVTKQFTSSNFVMLKNVDSILNQYPVHEPDLKAGVPPINAWIEGRLTIGQWGDQPNSDTATNIFYEIKTKEFSYSLLTQNEYFLANLQALEFISPALRRFIQIPVRVLCKVLYPLPDIKTFVVTPYIVKAIC
ncbi:hypothetical protein [Plesiomonas shigelloides]|uniref:hypothetical protein n=1 Tax=Plesiomonas shigelloides TaxID=703 RepID=UPI001261AA03|nr:hypothetical protein [Plesiomonas shigelloides]KAB7698130.1 hypothetical protein GBN15_06710 [Plesiomonas shigelloides]